MLSAAGLTSYAYKQPPKDDAEGGVATSGTSGGGGAGGLGLGSGLGGVAGVMGEADLLALALKPTPTAGRIVVVDQLPRFSGIGPHPLPPEKRKIFMYINKGAEGRTERHHRTLP